MQDLGKYVRHRYGNFIKTEYDTAEVFAQSSDGELSLASISLFLESFYAPTAQGGKISDIKHEDHGMHGHHVEPERRASMDIAYHAITTVSDNLS